ncbi:MAG: sodium/proline symporter PutP [Ancrocorticia sp.]|jgi:sodium/proline symporter|nr:sodium/proline symporter PutP [Ancrocorticia sp.]MCI2012275.1 sodium/proline symporter PutP [Ancrocorticia sp.]
MSNEFFMYLALGVYFAGMLLLGFAAFRRTEDHEDYMLGGRNLPSWVAAISAGAADMSGWLIMGLPGAIYATGLIESWIAIGLTIGQSCNWLFIAPRLRAYTEVAGNSITVPSFFENRLKDSSHVLRITASVVILVFFTLYVSSGMVAAGVFFESSFGLDATAGMLIVVAVTLAYTMFGGFLGVSLTDVAQGIMMCVALVVMPLVGIAAIGGFGETVTTVEGVAASNLSFFGTGFAKAATQVTIISGLAWGLGYVGQPHIVVRFMALRSPGEATRARRIGMSWMVISLAGAVISGLVGIAYFAKNGIELDNPETVVLRMSQILLHPFIAGLVLASVLAAIMSTFSSQLIVTSSALVEDVYRAITKKQVSQHRLVWMGRFAVLLVALVALYLALGNNNSILSLVGFAWAGFGAAFGPVTVLSLYWRKLTRWGAFAGMVAGAVSVFVWDWLDRITGDVWLFDIYELAFAFLISLLVAALVSLATYRHDSTIEEEFTRSLDYVKNSR